MAPRRCLCVYRFPDPDTSEIDMAERIAYVSWPATEIAGGIKLAFRHVEVLREAGLEAVVATPGAEPPGWFETDAPVADVSDLVRGQDVLVLPENHHGFLDSFADWPNRKLVFCQNHFMVCRGLAGRQDYADFGVCGILCVGRLVADFCRRRFPSLPSALVPVVVDQNLFHFQSQKRLQIAFAPRKRPLEAAFVQDLFRAENPQFRSVPWVQISGVSESEVAGILKDSAVYLSLSRFEAAALSILEALACGCVVAGFTGFGARQYTTTNNGFWAADDDCLDCVAQLTRAVRLVADGGAAYRQTLEAANVSAGYYSRERFTKRTVEFWQCFLAGDEFPK